MNKTTSSSKNDLNEKEISTEKDKKPKQRVRYVRSSTGGAVRICYDIKDDEE